MPRMADKHIPTAALQRWVDQLWLAAGCSAGEARLTAEHLVGANLAGHDSHGVGMVPRYVSSWLADELQLNQHVAVTSDSGAMLSLDAHRGMGQSMAYEAMNLAIERAQQHGVCVIGLKNAHHIGRIGHWADLCRSRHQGAGRRGNTENRQPARWRRCRTWRLPSGDRGAATIRRRRRRAAAWRYG